MAVIFDLDLTLIDSNIAEPFRKKRDWSNVYKLIPKFTIYDGILDLLVYLNQQRIPLCLVTSSPRPYCEKVMKHFGLRFNYMVSYHDTNNHKPHPEPIKLAIRHLNIEQKNCYALGDHPNDLEAARAAGTISVGCLWGAHNPELIINSKPDLIFKTPQKALEYFRSIY
jgi:HAD superfamily hydrolase (TIGR01509 family)